MRRPLTYDQKIYSLETGVFSFISLEKTAKPQELENPDKQPLLWVFILRTLYTPTGEAMMLIVQNVD